MKAAVFTAPGQIEVKEVAKPVIDGKNQAIIRVVRASCLWIRFMVVPRYCQARSQYVGRSRGNRGC